MNDTLAPAPAASRRRLIWIVVPVALILAMLIALLASSEPATNRISSSPLLGKAAPTNEGVDRSGNPFSLADPRGQWVLVNFFATWCAECVTEHPELVAFDESHDQSGDAVVVSLAFDDRAAAVDEFFERNGGDWPVVIDGTGPVAIDYGVSGVPESYLIAPNGRVVRKVIGGVTAEFIDQEIARLEAAAGVDEQSDRSEEGADAEQVDDD
jgi:cytochrome c biogenesis protein CcmG/thiol:disulfide interchange protein DsbE